MDNALLTEASSGRRESGPKPIIRLALYGDSLLNIPCYQYGLLEKLRALIKAKAQTEIIVDNHCWNGAKIGALREGLAKLVDLKYDMDGGGPVGL